MSIRHRRKVLSLGVISEGTLKAEDIVSAMASELAPLRLSRSHRALVAKARRFDPSAYDDDDLAASNAADDLLTDLMNAAEDYLPAYAHIGMAEGDGACLGVWASLESLSEDARFGDGVLKVADTGEVPRGYSGFVMDVNDHGNVTLYRASRGKLREIWAIV